MPADHLFFSESKKRRGHRQEIAKHKLVFRQRGIVTSHPAEHEMVIERKEEPIDERASKYRVLSNDVLDHIH